MERGLQYYEMWKISFEVLLYKIKSNYLWKTNPMCSGLLWNMQNLMQKKTSSRKDFLNIRNVGFLMTSNFNRNYIII